LDKTNKANDSKLTEKEIEETINHPKAKEVTSFLRDLEDKEGEVFKKHFDAKNIDIGIREVEGNASHDRTTDGRRFIFFNEDKAKLFRSGMEKLHIGEELSIAEKKAINSYSHENVHNRQKENWYIDTNTREGQIAKAISESLTELIGRKHIIDYSCEVDKNINRKYLENTLNEYGAYNKTANRFDTFLKRLGKKDIFNEIEKNLKIVNHNNIVKCLVDIVNNGKIKDIFTEEDIINVLLGE